MIVKFQDSQVKSESATHSVLPRQETLKNEEKQEVEIESTKVECESLRINIDELQNEIKKLTTRLAQATITNQNEEKELRISEEQKKIKARTYELLQDGPENIKKLESIIEASTNKLISLANQWEKHRVPLIMKYRQEREKHSTKAVSIAKNMSVIKGRNTFPQLRFVMHPVSNRRICFLVIFRRYTLLITICVTKLIEEKYCNL